MEQTEQQVKLYDPLDVAEGFSLAYGQAQDLLVMIKAVKTIYESEIQLIRDAYNHPDLAMLSLERLLNIIKLMLSDFIDFSKSQEEFYINQV